MSDKGIEAVGGAAEMEATTNVGELLDADGLAAQLETLLDSKPESEPAPDEEKSSEGEKSEGEQLPDEGEPSGPPEDEANAEEDALSQTEEETAEAEPALDADEQSEKDKANKGLFKRIDKLTAKRREAEGRVDELEAEIRTLRTELDAKEELPSLPPVDGNPYGHLKSTQDVEREMNQAEEVLEWCEDNADGAVVKNSKGEEVEYSAEEIRGIKKNARKSLKRHLPNRLEYLKEETAVAQQVEQVFPYWKDRSSEGYQEAMQILRNRPDIRNHPTWKADVSIFQLGLQAYREMVNNPTQKAAAKKEVKKAPEQPAAPAAAPATTGASKARSVSARKNFKSENTVDSLATILESDYI
tara:strand:+ start:643 stop:1713 length:1071 start_codon:yes stop_codon:yes gene_type:complete